MYIFKKILFIFRERGKEGERRRETSMCERYIDWLPLTPPTGDLACNPIMCPDLESNRRPLGSQASTQSTDLHQPGLLMYTNILKCSPQN